MRLLVLLLCWSDQKYTRHVQCVCWCCCYAGLARSTHGMYSPFVGVAVMLVWPEVHTACTVRLLVLLLCWSGQEYTRACCDDTVCGFVSCNKQQRKMHGTCTVLKYVCVTCKRQLWSLLLVMPETQTTTFDDSSFGKAVSPLFQSDCTMSQH